MVFTLFSTAAFALDALAIAAQALIGKYLGAHDVLAVRAVLRRTLQWGALFGVAVKITSSPMTFQTSTAGVSSSSRNSNSSATTPA